MLRAETVGRTLRIFLIPLVLSKHIGVRKN